MGSSVKKRSFRIEYSIGLLALAFAIFGYYCALAFYWSGLKNSPFGYETCGMEFAAWVLFIYPAYIVSCLLKALLVLKFNYKKRLAIVFVFNDVGSFRSGKISISWYIGNFLYGA